MITFLILQPPLQLSGAAELKWQHDALQVYNLMIAKGYKQLAAEWRAFYPAFHKAHPHLTVKQVLSAFIGEVAASGIAGGLSQGLTVIGKVPGAIAQGGENATSFFHNPLDYLKYPAEFLHALTEKSTWVRVAEFVIGITLIYVGIRAATGGAGQATVSGAKKTGSIAGTAIKRIRKATPTGRAASAVTKTTKRPKVDYKARRAAGSQRNQSRAVRGLAPRKPPPKIQRPPKAVHHE